MPATADAGLRLALCDDAERWAAWLDELAQCARRGEAVGSEMPATPFGEVLAALAAFL